MATTNQECPVAKKSLLPYLTGKLEGTPDGAAFEEHVKECASCRELVSDRRKALQTLIAAINDEEETPKQKVNLIALSPKQWKPLAISSVVAVVLIGVSYFIRPDGNLFGEKVEVEPAATTTVAPKEPTKKPLESQVVPKTPESKPLIADASVENKSTPETKPVVETPKPENPINVEPPKPVAPKPKVVAKPKPRITRKPISKPKPPTNRIEVFDENGKRIGISIKP